jgi:hypothetical protein
MRWPQITVIVFMALSVFDVLTRYSCSRKDKKDVLLIVFSMIIQAVILGYGGFWS